MSQTYTPTFLENILGKYYKWWYIVVYNFKVQRAYRADTVMWTLFSIFRFLGTFFIWWLTTKDNQNFDTTEIFTYLFLGNLLNTFINNWIPIDLGQMNKSGEISSKILTPTDFLHRMYLSFLGRGMLANFSTSVFGYILCLPILWNYLSSPSSLLNLFLLILIIPIAYSIRLFAGFVFGCLTFWMTETEGANNFFFFAEDFFSGRTVPLNFLLPFAFFIPHQPFAWTLHHPMQIYLGKYNFTETLLVFLGGILWCFALYFLAKWVFKMGLKRNESVGL